MPNEEAVFEDALAAYAELVGDEDGGAPTRYDVVVSARDRAALLGEWFGELMFLAETRDFVPARASAVRVRTASSAPRWKGGAKHLAHRRSACTSTSPRGG